MSGIYRHLLDAPPIPCHADARPSNTVSNSSAYTSNHPSGPGTGLREHPIQPTSEKNTFAPPAGDMRSVAIHGVDDTEAGQGDSGGAIIIAPKLCWKQWAMFVAGNLICIAVIVSVMARLVDACFNEFTEGGNDDDDDADDVDESFTKEPPQAFTKLPTKELVFATLVSGLMVDTYFAVFLSIVYRSPVGLKSVHKVPSEALSSTSGKMNVCVLAPFSWALIYLLGGIASQYVSWNSTCVRQGGSALGVYLKVSGVVMTIIGCIFLVIAAVGLRFSLGSHNTGTEGRGAEVRCVISQDCLLLDVFWKIQIVVWAYQTGEFGLAASVVVGICAVVGGVLTEKGSVAPAPDMPQG